MSQENSQINEFLTNPEFVRWVRDPDKELEVYWLQWMEAHPDKMEHLKLAREIIQGFQFNQKLPDQALKQDVLATILNGDSKYDDRFDNKIVMSNRQSFGPHFWTRINQLSKVAAILVLAFGLVFTLHNFNGQPPQPLPVAQVKTIHKT